MAEEPQLSDPKVVGVRTGAKMRVPRQSTRIGKAGYKGDVEVFEPSAPGVRMAAKEAEAAEDKAVAAPKRSRKKAGTPEAMLEEAGA